MSVLGEYGPCDACSDGEVFETFASGCPMCSRPAPDADMDVEDVVRFEVRDDGGAP